LTALEKIIHAQHPSSLPQKVSSRGICPAFAACTRATRGTVGASKALPGGVIEGSIEAYTP
jgi:hypothetical protein